MGDGGLEWVMVNEMMRFIVSSFAIKKFFFGLF